MVPFSRDRDRAQLEQELRTDEYQELMRVICGTDPFFRQFQCWAQVIAVMRAGTSEDPLKDEILRPIFRAHHEDQDPRWRAILLVIFWPALTSIHRRKCRWAPDPDEFWQTIHWIFLQVLCAVDVLIRPNRLVQKVVNETFHRVYRECRREWIRSRREVGVDPEIIEELVPGEEDLGLAMFELRDEQEQKIRRLREHLVAGRISEEDFFLDIGTRIYGRRLEEFAGDSRREYERLKTRRLRAEAAIRRFEKKSR